MPSLTVMDSILGMGVASIIASILFVSPVYSERFLDKIPPEWQACQKDGDCMQVPKSPCHGGCRAINKNYHDDYRRALGPDVCPAVKHSVLNTWCDRAQVRCVESVCDLEKVEKSESWELILKTNNIALAKKRLASYQSKELLSRDAFPHLLKSSSGELIELLLAAGVGQNYDDSGGEQVSPINKKAYLWRAHMADNKEAIAALEKYGATMKPREQLIVCIKNSEIDQVKSLLKKYPELKSTLNPTGYDWVRYEISGPLHFAAQRGNPEMVELLVRHGADVDGGKVRYDTPIISASKKDHLAVVQKLLDLGADLDRAAKDVDNHRPFIPKRIKDEIEKRRKARNKSRR